MGHPISPSELGSPDANERIIHFPRQFSMTSTFHGMSRASAKIGCNYILIDNIYIYIQYIYPKPIWITYLCESHYSLSGCFHSQNLKVGLVNASHVLYSFHISWGSQGYSYRSTLSGAFCLMWGPVWSSGSDTSIPHALVVYPIPGCDTRRTGGLLLHPCS